MSFNLLQYYFELIGVNTPTLGLKYCVESHIRSGGGGGGGIGFQIFVSLFIRSCLIILK